jgi:hypothetical protein
MQPVLVGNLALKLRKCSICSSMLTSHTYCEAEKARDCTEDEGTSANNPASTSFASGTPYNRINRSISAQEQTSERSLLFQSNKDTQSDQWVTLTTAF